MPRQRRRSPRVSSTYRSAAAQSVGSDFISQFYEAIKGCPHRALQFYGESSKLARPDPHGTMDIVTTLGAIKEKILATDFRESSIDIKTVDEQESLNGGGTVLVTGSLTGMDTVKKDFTQSFFLVPKGKGYFVLNDIFRYVDMNGHQAGNVGLVDGRNKSLVPQWLQSEKVPIRGSSVGPNHSVATGSKPSAQVVVVATGSKPSAQVVGNAFTSQFYSFLHQSPQLVYRFYRECSKLGRPEPHGAMGSVTTLKAINKNIQAMNLKDSSMVITTVDAQESFHGGVTVLVTGSLTDKGTVKDFVQSFFLAPQEKGYYTLNDIFRYVDDDDDHQQQNISCIPATPVGTTPVHPSIPEDVQLAMAINASIESAITEGVPLDLNVPDMRSKHKTGDTKEGSSSNRKNLGSCVICFDAPVEGACIPCGHMAGCMSCLNGIKGKGWGCPVCRTKIDQVLRLYAV